MFNKWASEAILFIILMAYLSGCVTVDLMKSEKQDIRPAVLEKAPAGKAQALVVVVHGLNLKPEKMDDWVQTLIAHGAHVLRLTLFGHGGDEGQIKTVTPEIWHAQFAETMAMAAKIAQEQELPIYLLGFSLGSLVGLEWLASQASDDGKRLEKMALLAPALAVPWYSITAIKMLSVFGQDFLLPSRSPKDYRANPGTSIAAYQALFGLKKSLEEKKYQNANIDTLVLIDKNDELVDSRAIRQIIHEHRLSRWILDIVDNSFAFKNYGFRHLMVDKQAMGPDLWQRLNVLVLRHFGLLNPGEEKSEHDENRKN